jgi:hypothetical protein
MGQVSYELIIALALVGGITVGYVYVAERGVPQPSGLVGHTLGIVGFLLMLSTETLYSLRKRLPRFHYGRMSLWLQAHIITGIVGPYLVVLHAGWKFNGLAGVLTLLTLVVVVSGLIGRYIYTAVPRTLEGAEVAVAELEQRIGAADRRIKELGLEGLVAAASLPPRGWRLVLARPFLRWRLKRRLRRAVAALDPAARTRAEPLLKVLLDRQNWQLQILSVDVARRLLAVWHVFHVPLTGVVFTLAAVHIGAALYYATFLK